MGQRSKAHQAHENNLPKNTKAGVDDYSNNDDDYRPPSESQGEEDKPHHAEVLFLDEDDLESDIELEDEDEDLVVGEIASEREAAILRFSAVLTEAQAMAVKGFKAEQELEGK